MIELMGEFRGFSDLWNAACDGFIDLGAIDPVAVAATQKNLDALADTLEPIQNLLMSEREIADARKNPIAFSSDARSIDNHSIKQRMLGQIREMWPSLAEIEQASEIGDEEYSDAEKLYTLRVLDKAFEHFTVFASLIYGITENPPSLHWSDSTEVAFFEKLVKFTDKEFDSLMVTVKQDINYPRADALEAEIKAATGI